jgi:5'(3')-deoxyribonucleotidase
MKILYIDMDNVLVDFQSGIDAISEHERLSYEGRLDEVPGIFSKMKPKEGAIEAFKKLSKNFDTYILSTAPWENSSAWSDKLIWVKKYLDDSAYKRLILSHNKHMNTGDYLIDDRPNNGAKDFQGELIPFHSKEFPDSPFKNWDDILNYLLSKK